MKNKTLFWIIGISLFLLFTFDFYKVFNYFGDIIVSNRLKSDLIQKVMLVDPGIDKEEGKEKITIDFPKLFEINKDTVGWIKYNDDKINYPIVQAKDNDYYLKLAFDGKKNQSGSIFMDYRNFSFDDRNVVLFGHSMLDGSMFGSLREVFKDDFFNNSENNYIKIYTPDEGELTYQIFSYYITDVEEYYITTSFTEASFQEFIKTIVSRSERNFNVEVNSNDKILTLSTCSGTGDTKRRKVVHAKRIDLDENINI